MGNSLLAEEVLGCIIAKKTYENVKLKKTFPTGEGTCTKYFLIE